MVSVDRIFEWDMGHRVPNHKSLCKNPHGHRYKLIVEVTGPINEDSEDPAQGMVMDFGDLTKLINQHVIDRLDHAFMYWANDTIMLKFSEANKNLKLIKVPFVPTAECIVEYLSKEIQACLNHALIDIYVIRLTLNETPKSRAIWRK